MHRHSTLILPRRRRDTLSCFATNDLAFFFEFERSSVGELCDSNGRIGRSCRPKTAGRT